MNNRYFALRHGESEINKQGIILSDPKLGTKSYSLTKNGKVQVKHCFLNNNLLDEKTIIYSSDFLRTKETAEIAKQILNIDKIHFTKKLRERFFGNWDKTSDENYEKVWREDKKNPDHELNNVESANSVLDRATSLIIELEKKHEGKNILLVAHGDALQILQTGFLKISPSRHRDLPHLHIGEIRELKLSKKISKK